MLTEERVWKSDSIMAANADAGLKMPVLMALIRAIEAEVIQAPCPKCAKLKEENRKAQQEIAGDIVTIRKCDNLLKLSRAKVAYYEAQMCLPDGAFVAIPNGYSAQVAARSVSAERVADVITQRDELRAEVERLKDVIALSEDSQLMDQYIKAEREIERLTEQVRYRPKSHEINCGLIAEKNAAIAAIATEHMTPDTKG